MKYLKEFCKSLVVVALVSSLMYSTYLTHNNHILLNKIDEQYKLLGDTQSTEAAILYHIGTYTVACFHNTKRHDELHKAQSVMDCDECKKILKQRENLIEMAK